MVAQYSVSKGTNTSESPSFIWCQRLETQRQVRKMYLQWKAWAWLSGKQRWINDSLPPEGRPRPCYSNDFVSQKTGSNWRTRFWVGRKEIILIKHREKFSVTHEDLRKCGELKPLPPPSHTHTFWQYWRFEP